MPLSYNEGFKSKASYRFLLFDEYKNTYAKILKYVIMSYTTIGYLRIDKDFVYHKRSVYSPDHLGGPTPYFVRSEYLIRSETNI